jgi:enamine deaminase RidA (YjgF/YER057c/UK114 family)
MNPLQKLAELGLELPPAPRPQGAYVPVLRSGNLAFVSGQLPMLRGEVAFRGKVGGDVTLEQAREAARLCALNLLAALEGNGIPLASVRRVVKLTGFVQSAPDFFDQPKVINGASELLAEVFGEAGKHARAAVGAIDDLPRRGDLSATVADELKIRGEQIEKRTLIPRIRCGRKSFNQLAMLTGLDIEPRLVGAHTFPSPMKHLAHRRFGPACDPCDLRVIAIEDVMEQEDGSLGRGQTLEHQKKRDGEVRCEFEVFLC